MIEKMRLILEDTHVKTRMEDIVFFISFIWKWWFWSDVIWILDGQVVIFWPWVKLEQRTTAAFYCGWWRLILKQEERVPHSLPVATTLRTFFTCFYTLWSSSALLFKQKGRPRIVDWAIDSWFDDYQWLFRTN